MNEPRSTEAVPVVYPPYLATCPDDEIDLVDLWLQLRKHRKAFFALFLPLALLGLSYALFWFEETYSLTSAIQIGSLYEGGKTTLLESPESLLSKVKSAIAPAYTREWMARNEYNEPFDTAIENPKNSAILLLKNKVKEADIDLFVDYQRGLAEQVVANHHRLIESFRAPLNAQLEVARLKLKELEAPVTLDLILKALEMQLDEVEIKKKKLEDEAFFGIKKTEFLNRITVAQHEKESLLQKEKVLQEQLKRVDESRTLLGKHIESLQGQIGQSMAARRQAAKRATAESAMSQMLIGNEIQQSQQMLLNLEERYNVELPNKRSELLKKIDANRLAITDKEKAIDVLRQKYDKLLLDNKLQIQRLDLEIKRLKLEIEKAKLDHKKSVEEQQQKIERLIKQLKNYDETRVVGEPVESLKPVGLTQTVLYALVILIAGVIGFAAMLVALFRGRIRQRLAEQE